MMEDIPSQEMDRRLTEHFAEESRRLRAPASIWSSIRSRLTADSAAEKAFMEKAVFIPAMAPRTCFCRRCGDPAGGHVLGATILSCSREAPRKIENGCLWRRTTDPC